MKLRSNLKSNLQWCSVFLVGGLSLLEEVNKPTGFRRSVVFTEMCLLWLSDLIVARRDSRKASRGVANYSPVSDKREEGGSFREDETSSNHFLAE